MVGGLVGRMMYNSFANNSFWDSEKSKIDTSALGIKKTTQEMKYYKTFNNAGWDFKVWDIDNTAANYNDGYPFLAWQNNYQTLRDISSPVINIFALRSNGDTIAYNSTTNESEILLNFLSSEPTNNFAVEDISITNGKITNFKK